MAKRLMSGPVLGIETSCDETSVAIVLGTQVLANIVSSQAQMHEKWGGVVPEAAARAHVEAIIPALQEAMSSSGVALQDLVGIAVTNRPGLVGALSVGVSAARALSYHLRIPLVGVHHLEGHIISILEQYPDAMENLPQLCLIVSGGHTEVVLLQEQGAIEMVSETLDDAAGEAFDKSARLLGLGYPGGPKLQAAAVHGDPRRYPLPIALPKDLAHFSFSGLKTAVLRLVEREGSALHVPDAAASVQWSIATALSKKVAGLCGELSPRSVSVVGGVSANQELRKQVSAVCETLSIPCYFSALSLATDNAAMIALAGSLRMAQGQDDRANLPVMPNAPLPTVLAGF